MGTLHNRGPPAALPGAWNYINSLIAKRKAADQQVSPMRPERVSPIPPVAHRAVPAGLTRTRRAFREGDRGN